MACKKLEEFDKENPNYKFLMDGINNGSVQLDEDNCTAIISASHEQAKFYLGMRAYLETQGYVVN
jgi:hypothetical protein